eukprot:1322646-Prymnesium_polylepis.1
MARPDDRSGILKEQTVARGGGEARVDDRADRSRAVHRQNARPAPTDRTVPCRAAPCRTVPHRPARAVPCRAVPCRAVPCRAVPCRAPFPQNTLPLKPARGLEPAI